MKQYIQTLRSLIGPLGILLAIVGVAFGVYGWKQARMLKEQLSSAPSGSQQATEKEVRTLVSEIGKHIVLPTDEEPTLATITDREKLQNTPFFSRAENGDKVLIYVNAGKAYLYRPSSQKLVEVSSVNLQSTPSPEASPLTARVALRNGTTITGLTKSVDQILKTALPGLTISSRDDAKVRGVEKTLVVDLTGSRTADAERIAHALSAAVGALPGGEPTPDDTEFLVILGTDISTSASPAVSPSPS